jgi:RNA 2',3'-cyclic 3'-phosphodiesterase
MTTNLSKKDRLPGMRVFVAIELPEALRLNLSRLQTLFGSPAEAAKWVALDLLHITLRFLGEISEEQLRSVEAAARAAAAATGQFELAAGLPGAFPNERNPRVLWVGLGGEPGLAALQRLHDALETHLVERGFGSEDKGFSPHITVARVRDRTGSEARRVLGLALVNARSRPSGPPHTFPVDRLTVMRSDLGLGGPRYTPLSRIPLSGPRRSIVERSSESRSGAE